jgi:hypothetical protein
MIPATCVVIFIAYLLYRTYTLRTVRRQSVCVGNMEVVLFTIAATLVAAWVALTFRSFTPEVLRLTR